MGLLSALTQGLRERAGNEFNKRAFPIAQQAAEKAGVKTEFSRAYSQHLARQYNAKQAGLKAAQKRADLEERYRQGGYAVLSQKEAKAYERGVIHQAALRSTKRDRVIYSIAHSDSSYTSNYARREAMTQAGVKARFVAEMQANSGMLRAKEEQSNASIRNKLFVGRGL